MKQVAHILLTLVQSLMLCWLNNRTARANFTGFISTMLSQSFVSAGGLGYLWLQIRNSPQQCFRDTGTNCLRFSVL